MSGASLQNPDSNFSHNNLILYKETRAAVLSFDM